MSVESLQNRERLIGISSIEAVNFIIQSRPEIRKFTVVGYRPRLEWGEGEVLEDKGDTWGEETTGPVFAQGKFERTFRRSALNNPDFWRRLEDELKEVEIARWYSKEAEVPAEEAISWWKPQDRLYYLAMASKVYLSRGKERHLPTMRFFGKPEDEMRLWIKEEMLKREEHGLLLCSGTSFYFCGMRLLTREEWDSWIGSWWWKADNNYIFRCLYRDRYSSLTLTSGPQKPKILTVIDVL